MNRIAREDDPRTDAYVDPHGAYHVHYDPEGAAKLSTVLVHAISDVADVDVTDAGFVLNDVLDPDALDDLFGQKADGEDRAGGEITVTVLGLEVTVHGDGEIVLRELPGRNRGSPVGQ